MKFNNTHQTCYRDDIIMMSTTEGDTKLQLFIGDTVRSARRCVLEYETTEARDRDIERLEEMYQRLSASLTDRRLAEFALDDQMETPKERVDVEVVVRGPALTGKSTIARIINKALNEHGVETATSPEDFASDDVRTTEIKTSLVAAKTRVAVRTEFIRAVLRK